MRQAVLNLEESMIRQVANAGMGRDDVLKFWFGESDEVTPAFIRQVAADSLHSGETFYAHNLGLPELREEIALYCSAMRTAGAAPVGVDRVAVTAGGVNALMLAVQALVNAGDRVVVVKPVWPNLTAQPAIMGAQVHCVSLRPVDGQWQLDMAALLAAITPATRLLVLNAPNNPTGWTLSRAEQQALLAHCRSTGTWILADEVYERLYYEPTPNGCAPSFLDIADPDDRLAPGLAGDAAQHDAADGQADRVQHLLLAGVCAACRGGGVAAHRRGHAPCGRAPEGLPRYLGAAVAGAAGRATGAGGRRHVRVFPPDGASGVPGLAGHRQAPGVRGRIGFGPGCGVYKQH